MAIRKWSEIEQTGISKVTTFRDVVSEYQKRELFSKAKDTINNYRGAMKRLLDFFDNPPIHLDQMKPAHVRQYMNLHAATPSQANNDRAVLSSIWAWAINALLTDVQNPCVGIKRYKETPRDVYVDDNAYKALYECADQPLRDAMDLAWLTGQRPRDVMQMRQQDIKDGYLHLRQSKTGKKLRIAVTGMLADTLARIEARAATCNPHPLALVFDEKGYPITQMQMSRRYAKARKAVKGEMADIVKLYQFRDLRAKAATEKAETGGMEQAQAQLGHANVAMTQRYIRNKMGQKVEPTK